MRFRTLIIIVLIVAAATPAAIGVYARQRLQQELLAAGVAPERIVSVVGWRESRLLFPWPEQPALEMDLQLHHGPYLGASGWGWLGGNAKLLYLQRPAAQLQMQFSFDFWFKLMASAEPGLEGLVQGWHWQQLALSVQGQERSGQWRGHIQGEALSLDSQTDVPLLQLNQLALDWSWDQSLQPNLGLWLQAQGLILTPPEASAPLQVAALDMNSDWLEQGASGALRQSWQLHQISTLGRTLERVHGSWQLAPLERTTMHQLPQLLSAQWQQEENLATATWLIQLAPLLALRPRWEIDSLGVTDAGQAILLNGEVVARPGGVSIHTQGGGAESLYLRLLELLQFSQPDASAENATQRAEQMLQVIRRQGWLQARGQGADRELRADIVINY